MVAARPQCRAEQVLVTIGSGCRISSLGTVETERAMLRGDERLLGFAARDAGLVRIESCAAGGLRFLAAAGPEQGKPVTLAEIEARWGSALKARMGIRAVEAAPLQRLPSDLAAPLPHDLEQDGLRRLAGLTYDDIRGSVVSDMAGMFQEVPYLGPSLQAQLFLYGGLGALAALPVSLPELLPEAHAFRIAAGCAFAGQEHVESLKQDAQPGSTLLARADRLAYRLSSSLNTHGPALMNALLSPAYGLTKVRRQPELLAGLVSAGSDYRNVPQAPMVISGACASALLALADIAPQLLAGSAFGGPKLVLWTAADAPLVPDGRVIEGFGSGALLTSEKLRALNAQREPADQRCAADGLAPFDRDALGTVIGSAGSGILVTTLQFAIENFLDVTSIIAGWGQSGETGGKGHFAGVGFGGENAIIRALELADRHHGYGVGSFHHLIPHATGTQTNSRTDLATALCALQVAAARQGGAQRVRKLSVGAPKALGAGHTMGEAGLRSASEAIRYLLNEPTVGVPTLRAIDPEIADCAEHFQLGSAPVQGNEDGGALTFAQGFGGYVSALALRAAHPDALRRYQFADPAQLDAYLERRHETRRQRIQNEQRAWLMERGILALIERHRWRGLA